MPKFVCSQPYCSAVVELTERQEAHHRETKESFFCPAGHKSWFKGPTELETKVEELERANTRLTAELARAREARERAEALWRCPHAGCNFGTRGRGNLVQHLEIHEHLRP